MRLGRSWASGRARRTASDGTPRRIRAPTVAMASPTTTFAAALGIGETTVKTQAVVVAYESGLVRPGRGTQVARSG
jgi:hypothetical protein